MILADTKFEFGFIDDEITLIDELLTPDSSRFWDANDWRPGSSPHAFDKQYVRNWLTQAGWNKEPPAPALPDHVIREREIVTKKRSGDLRVAMKYPRVLAGAADRIGTQRRTEHS